MITVGRQAMLRLTNPAIQLVVGCRGREREREREREKEKEREREREATAATPRLINDWAGKMTAGCGLG
jgi:hypothetical protein